MAAPTNAIDDIEDNLNRLPCILSLVVILTLNIPYLLPMTLLYSLDLFEYIACLLMACDTI